MVQGQLLRNHPAEREAHNVNGLQTQCATESDAMWRHLRDGVGRFSSRSSHACVIKKDDLMSVRKAVCDGRIPSIHIRVEVPEKEQWNRTCPPEAAIRVAHALGFYELCRDCFMCVFAR